MKYIIFLLALTACGKLNDVNTNVETGNKLQEQILIENQAIHKDLDELLKRIPVDCAKVMPLMDRIRDMK